MKCPNCKDLNLVISERKGIEIDYCPDCRGVWLDRGELDKIIEKSNSERLPEQYDQRDHRDSHRVHYKKRKSFFEEIFD